MPAKTEPGKRAPRNPDGPKPKRLKQGFIPGSEPPHHPDIDNAAEDYREARDERMRLCKIEREKTAALLRLMHEHGLQTYTHDGYTVRVESLEMVKVNKAGNGDGEE